MGALKDWIPFFSTLVWPLFIALILVLFRNQIKSIIKKIIQAIGEGRSVQIGDWLRIGEKTTIAELAGRTTAEVGEALDISVDSVGGFEEFVEKSSYSVLENLRQKLQTAPTQRIDVLLIVSGKKYSSRLLRSYISDLAIRFVVFQKQNQFDGWIDAGMFNSQLPTMDVQMTYDDIRRDIIGIRKETVAPGDSSVAVLKAMDKSNLENIAVVDGDQFRFIAERGSILSKLITTTLFKEKTA